jgi:acrylyl-CoA reductase (NADPH)
MTDRFRALLISKDGEGQKVHDSELSTGDLMDGNVVIAVSYSTVNYKDALALTGRAPVVRRFPMIPGIDLAGTVETSEDSAFRPGDRVLINGFGLGETHYGGYAERARVKSEWLLPIPGAFSFADAMVIGTAGYTAMLAVLAIEDAEVKPESGPVVVTGAAGGVGSVAVALLSKLGWRVIASTGRVTEEAYLKNLGAQ